MRVIVFGFVIAVASMTVRAAPLFDGLAPDRQQSSHAQGVCGSLGIGTGLVGGRGWVVSMLPGRHEFRVNGRGAVQLTAAKVAAWDFDAGRPYYIVMEDTSSSSSLEWKVPGSSTWAPVPVTFLYPPAGVTYGR